MVSIKNLSTRIDIDKACEDFNTFVDKVVSQKFKREWIVFATDEDKTVYVIVSDDEVLEGMAAEICGGVSYRPRTFVP